MSCKPIFLANHDCRNVIQVLMCDEKEEFSCCGDPLERLEPNTSEGAREKHLPVVILDGNRVTVKVGSVYHPMTEEHSIGWIYLQTSRGGQHVYLTPEHKPEAEFLVSSEEIPLAVYSYCNLHGFWKTEIADEKA